MPNGLMSFTSTYIFVGQWNLGSHVGLYFSVLIRKEIHIFSQFKHLCLSDAGFPKGSSPSTPENVAKVAAAGSAALAG